MLIEERNEGNDDVLVLQSLVYSNCKKKVRNHNCECEEMEKTGVACPHLILANVASGITSYNDLISQRWVQPTKRNDMKKNEG